jgi:hypothetical protein
VTVIELDVEIPDLAEVEVETPDVEITPSGGATVVLVATLGPPGPQGPPGDGVQVFGETLTGAINGTNTVYITTGDYRADSTALYLNGLREFHYTESGPSQITLEDPPLAGDSLRIDYVV